LRPNLTKRVIAGIPFVAAAVALSSCMTFRSSHKEIKTFFKANKVDVNINEYKSGYRRMEYISTGDSTRPMVLFVHGSPGSLNAFAEYLADSTLLSNAFLVSADRPGFGYSNFGNAEPSLARQGEILSEIILRYPSARPVILVGHSLGGPLVAKMAIDNPGLIDALVIIAGSIDPELEPNEMWFRAPLKTPFLRWILPRSLRASNDELYHLKSQLEEMIPDWKKITCPVVVIHGKKDELVPFENIEFARRHLTNANVRYILLDNSGHFIPWQNEDKVVEGIMNAVEATQMLR
jgi:pimeloyl-ACP methyl ester carboxylesterase